MSDKDFNKKIRQKLYEHESEYDPNAWQKMKGLLPTPWYTSFLQTYGGWLWGALASTALLFTFLYQNTKNEELYEEISTLKQQLSVSKSDTVFVNQNITDTLYLTRVIQKMVEVPVLISENTFENRSSEKSNDESTLAGLPESSNTTSNFQNQNSEVRSENRAEVAREHTVSQKPQADHLEFIESQESQKIISEEENSLFKDDVNQIENTLSNIVKEQKDNAEKTTLDIPATNAIEEIPEESKAEDEVVENKKVDEEQENIEKGEKNLSSSDPVVTQKRKKLSLPKMRVGITSDYMGLNVLANGINAEFFLFDRLSLNTSLVFTGLVETKHPLLSDFNRKTGKDFMKEFERFNPRFPARIKDISIQTSFVRLPIHFNYYISTWSRFKFIVSAGTKLDLSVYQDIDFNSGSQSSPVRNRFEARPQPQVLNNLNYGMGLEYQYKGFVGQLMPYFDFNFRKTDYFTPKRKFGVMGSLKYQLGK